MKNRVRVRATFSFRGETFHPEMVLDLDRFIADGGRLEELHAMLAAANGIDTGSYEYEVLEVSPLEFDRPEGLAARYLEDGILDLEGLREAMQGEERTRRLEEIARRHMEIEDPRTMPGLMEALEAAWRLGREG